MGQVIKKENWDTLLSNYLCDCRDKPFRWGSHDCIMHAINAVKAMTGYDIAKRYRGKYKSELSAYRIIESDFDGQMDNVFNNHLGQHLTSYGYIKRGDVIKTSAISDQPVYGVIDDSGTKMTVISKERGIIFLPINVDCYWSF